MEIDARYIHADCAECCGIGRCHWCLTKAGPAILFDEVKQLVVRACTKHANLAQTSERFPDVALVVWDGTFRPVELTLDEETEASGRAIHALNHMHAASTPATLR